MHPVQRKLILIRHWIRVLTLYRAASLWYKAQMMYHGARAAYWKERMYLNYQYSLVAGALGSLVPHQVKLLRTQAMLLGQAKFIAKWTVKKYPSTRRQLQSETWLMPECSPLEHALSTRELLASLRPISRNV